MASGSVASRVLGLVRTLLLTAAIGLSFAGDAFAVANTLPNIIYLVIAGGVLNSVLVPQLVKAASDPDGGQEFTDRIITMAGAAILGLTIVATAAAPLLTRLFAGQFTAETLSLATAFAFICLPQILFYGLYALLGQVLNARGRLLAFGWAPFVGNVVAVAALAAFMVVYPGQVALPDWTPGMIWLLAGGATSSIIVQPIFLWVALRRSGYRFQPRWGLRGVGLRETSVIARWALAALGLSQLGFLVSSNLMANASAQRTDAHYVAGNAVQANAILVFTLPHAFVALSIITALYPRMSRAAQAHDLDALRHDYARGLTVPTALTWPASVAMLVFALPLARLLIPARDVEVRASAAVIAAMALGVVPFGIDVLNQRFFYAHADGRRAFFEQVVLTLTSTSVALSSLFFAPDYTVGIVGVALVVSSVASSTYGMWFVRRRVGHLGLRNVVRSWVRMALASAVAAGVAVPLRMLLDSRTEGRGGALLTVVVAGGMFGVVYLGLARAMHIGEVADLLGPVLRRVRRSRGADH